MFWSQLLENTEGVQRGWVESSLYGRDVDRLWPFLQSHEGVAGCRRKVIKYAAYAYTSMIWLSNFFNSLHQMTLKLLEIIHKNHPICSLIGSWHSMHVLRIGALYYFYCDFCVLREVLIRNDKYLFQGDKETASRRSREVGHCGQRVEGGTSPQCTACLSKRPHGWLPWRIYWRLVSAYMYIFYINNPGSGKVYSKTYFTTITYLLTLKTAKKTVNTGRIIYVEYTYILSNTRILSVLCSLGSITVGFFLCNNQLWEELKIKT